MGDRELTRRLLELRDRDVTKRQELVERGEPRDGYRPESGSREEPGPQGSYAARQAEILAWARRVGWIED